MDFYRKTKMFLEYLRLLTLQWRNLLLLLLEVDSLISFFFNVDFQIPAFLKYILVVLIVIWSGYTIYFDLSQRLKAQSELKFSVDIAFSDGNQFNFSLTNREALKEKDFDDFVNSGIAVDVANDEIGIEYLPKFLCTINGRLENDGDVPVRVIDIKATPDVFIQTIELTKANFFKKKQIVFDKGKLDSIMPFDFGPFSTILSSNTGYSMDFPVRLDSGDKILFKMHSEIQYQTSKSHDGYVEELTPAQVASRLRQMSKNQRTNINIRAEFEDFDGQKPSQVTNSALSITFRNLNDALLNYWGRHEMMNLVEIAQQKNKH